MKSRILLWVAAAVCGLSIDSLAQPTPAPSGRAKAGPAASASASAANVEIPPWPAAPDSYPAFDAQPFPSDKTKAPVDADWKDAIQVRLSRISPGVPSGCRAWRVREWMKIHCEEKTAGVRMLAGDRQGVSVFVAQSLPYDIPAMAKQFGVEESAVHENMEKFPDDGWMARDWRLQTTGRFGEVVFPVRPGDRRVFEWLKLDIWEGYDGPPSVGAESTMILEEQWLEGEAPRIALTKR